MEDKYLFDEIIRLGYACNEKCLFCNFTPINEPGYKEKTAEDVFQEIDELIIKYETAKNISLFFSGGEPLLWGEKLFQMIEYANKKGVGKIGIQTNATLITESKAKRISDLGVDDLLISLHAHNDSINDQITLHKQSFTKAIKGIKNVQKYGINFTINHVLNKINYTYFDDYLDFLKDFGILEISLGVVQPHGYAEENFEDIMIDYNILVPFLKKGFKRADTLGIKLISHYCDIPLCKFDKKISSDLNFESLLQIRKTGVDKYDKFVDDLSHSKVKLKTCKSCIYNNYCFGVWTKYVRNFGENSIQATKTFIPYFPLGAEIHDEKYFIVSNNSVSINHRIEVTREYVSQFLDKPYFVIQYYILGTDFCLLSDDFLREIIIGGVNVININIKRGEEIYIDKLLRNILSVEKIQKNNTPYYNVSINIRSEIVGIENIISDKFKSVLFLDN